MSQAWQRSCSRFVVLRGLHASKLKCKIGNLNTNGRRTDTLHKMHHTKLIVWVDGIPTVPFTESGNPRKISKSLELLSMTQTAGTQWLGGLVRVGNLS